MVCFFKQYFVTTYLTHSHTCGLEVEHHHSMLHPKKNHLVDVNWSSIKSTLQITSYPPRKIICHINGLCQPKWTLEWITNLCEASNNWSLPRCSSSVCTESASQCSCLWSICETQVTNNLTSNDTSILAFPSILLKVFDISSAYFGTVWRVRVLWLVE